METHPDALVVGRFAYPAAVLLLELPSPAVL
jgi:hypothetical protein